MTAALAFALSSCAAPQTAPASIESTGFEEIAEVEIGDQAVLEGGDLVVALSGDPDVLDPTLSSTLLSRIVLQAACEKLYELDTSGQVQPMLATDLPTVSEDGLVVTIPVRENAVFSDGTPMDADAVANSLERHYSNPASARTSELGSITDIQALDETTVQITFSEPFAPLLPALVAGAGVVMSPAALAELGDDFGDSPSCVGPFTVVERIPQTSIRLERDPNYYAADEIHLDSITFQIMADSSLRATNLTSGDVQVADVISTQDVDSLMGSEATGMLMTSSLGYQHLDVNLGNDGPGNPPKQIDTPLAQEPLVRQALSMAIDREALVDSVFGGWFEPTCSPIPEVSGLSSDASDECPEHDPEGAVALLEEAGVEVPYEVELRIPNFPDNLRLGQALQAMVAEGGFDLGVAPVEYSTLNADSIQGNYDLEQQSWSGRLDPNGNMYNFLTTDGGYNRTGYSNRQVDQLLADATATYDTQERIALYGQAMQIVHEDNPLIFLYRIRNLTGYSADVAGIEAYVDGVFDVSRAAFLE